MNALIRPAADSDIPAVASIYAHYVLTSTATFEIDPPAADEIFERRSRILALGLPYLVAEREGLVVGFAYAGPYRPRPAYRFTVEDSVYVHPEHAGRGYGARLLGGVIEHCWRGEWRQMIAVIGGADNRESIRLHERFSFTHVGRLRSVGFKFDAWVDTVLMQRELEP